MLPQVTRKVGNATTSLSVLGKAGLIRPHGPLTLARLGRTVHQWGTGPAGGFAAMALRAPAATAVVDELGALTWGELQQRSNALATALRGLGVTEGDGVAVMCRNHRGFIDATIAVAKLGADVLYLNTAFAGPQLVEVLAREKPRVLIYDAEFEGLVGEAEVAIKVVAWTESTELGHPTLESLIASHPGDDLAPPQRHGRTVILTSGTTGTPKGAPRSEAGIDAAVALLGSIPLKYGWRTHIAAPMFHTWGFAHFALAMLLGTPMVLRRRFDPEDFLATVREHHCEVAVVIPVMLQRALNLPDDVLDRYPLPQLQVVASSGSALPGDLATTWMDRFGDNLYSTYGSTEVAYASVAAPADLRQSPATAGRPPHATVVRIVDEQGVEVPEGHSGRIFVGNGMLFEGYTGGGNKEIIDGLMSTGDVGRFERGLLYVEGRDDEMIVSGGENVFPKEVEDCLARHDLVVEVAAIGVDDAEFGQRLRAFVVTSGDVEEAALKNWVKENLARYKVPRDFVFIEELPRNATGKVLKKDLVNYPA